MKMKKLKVSSFVNKGNELIAKGNTPEAMQHIVKGLNHYENRVIEAITPYATEDAGLLVITLRHLADQIEKGDPNTKVFVDGMNKVLQKPELPIETEFEK